MAAIHALSDLASLRAVADSVPDRARLAAERWGAERVYSDYRDLLGDPAVDAVVICLPHHLHRQATVDAAAAGKHILVEKPMALDAAQAEDMVKAAETAGVTLMVGQSRRFSDAAIELVSRRDELGQPIRWVTHFLVYFPEPPTAWWNSPEEAGILILSLQGVHYFDLAQWYTRQTPSRVFAVAWNHNPKCGGSDEGDVTLLYDGPLTASIHLSLNCRPEVHETVVEGERGVARLVEYPTGRPFGFGYRLFINGKLVVDGDQQPSNYELQMREFVSAVLEGRQPLASGREVLPVMRVLDAAARSVRTGRVEGVIG